MKINVNTLGDSLKKARTLSEDEGLVMELLNYCEKPGLLTRENLVKFKAKHFLQALKNINLGGESDMLKQMVEYEFAKSNFEFCEEVLDEDEEIY